MTANFVRFITTPLLILSSHEDSVFTNHFGCAPKYGTPEYEEFRGLLRYHGIPHHAFISRID